MARGGARNRSGPQPDPNSARSDRRGIKLTSLPATGYDGQVPDWPLPSRTVYYFDEDKARRIDEAATEADFASAAHKVRFDVGDNRIVVNSMEPRGCYAQWDDQGRVHFG